MSKPYFTKYIPVEGEIKEGDWIEREWYPPVGNFIREIVQYKGYMKSLSEKKVKLFLCSRNIKVGDQVFDVGYQSELKEFEVVDTPKTFIRRPGLAGINPDINIGNPVQLTQYAFKVIGEISPHALVYVKEGMEYKEEGKDFRRMGYMPDEPVTIQIKCPCCLKFN